MLNLVFNTLSVADATELNRELEIYYLISPQKILNSSIERGGGDLLYEVKIYTITNTTVHLLVKKKYKFDYQTLPRLSFAYIYRVFVNEIENRRTQHYLFGTLDFMTFAAIYETMLLCKTTIIKFSLTTKTSARRFVL